MTKTIKTKLTDKQFARACDIAQNQGIIEMGSYLRRNLPNATDKQENDEFCRVMDAIEFPSEGC
jgi:hypothetical protein